MAPLARRCSWTILCQAHFADCPPALHPGEDGRLFNTPECAAEEIEERINSLQDEFEELCERARRAVCVTGKRRAQLAAALWPLADPATRGL
jgi:hypothetical protein